ncbi:AAA family ATPase [Actinokineospora sp. NPDC004072]
MARGHGNVRCGPVPIAGREAELAALLDAVRRGEPVVFVEGPAGVGKSRLVAEFAAACTGVRVVVGACQPLAEPFPFGVLLDCLSQCDELRSPGPVTGALRGHLPELADRLPPAPPALGDPAAERHRLFRAVRALLRCLGPTVLVLEDLQWADQETRDVLRFVLGNPPPGLSIVATYRREDLPAGAPLGRVVHGRHLAVRPLDAAGVRAVIDAVVGAEAASERFAEVVLHESGGLPFVVEEIIRALPDPLRDVRADGDRARELVDGIEAPVLVADAVRERLRALPAGARALAEAAAVLGVPESADILAAVAGTREHPGGALAEEEANRDGLRPTTARPAAADTMLGVPESADFIAAAAGMPEHPSGAHAEEEPNRHTRRPTTRPGAADTAAMLAAPESGDVLAAAAGTAENPIGALAQEPDRYGLRPATARRATDVLAAAASAAENPSGALAEEEPNRYGPQPTTARQAVAEVATVRGGPESGDVLATVEHPVGALAEEEPNRYGAQPTIAQRAVAEVATVRGVPGSADVLAAVEHAVGVLVEEEPNRYGLWPAIARRVVVAGLPGPRRRELHERAVAVLAVQEPAPVGRLAAHAKAAGMVRDWLRYAELAAEAAADAATAVDLLSQVLADPATSVADTNRLAVALCGHALSGLPGGAVTARVEGLLADPRLTPDVRGEVHLWFGLLLQRETGEIGRGAAEIAQAVDLLADQPERTVRGLAAVAGPYLGGASIAENRASLGRVEGIAERLPTPALRMALLATTLGGRLIVGDPSTWERVADLPSPAQVRDPDEIHHLARAHCNLADACSWIGHYRRAREFLRDGISLAERVAADYVVGTAEATAVRLDWLCGRWAGLEQRIDRLVAAYANLLLTTDLNLTRGWLAAARGEWGRAEEAFQAAGAGEVFPVGIGAAGGMAGMLLSRGKAEAAEEHVERGVAVLRRKGAWVWSGDILPQAVDCYLAVDRPDAARQLVAEAAAGLGGVDAPLARAALTGCRARLAAAEDHPDADRLYRDAIGQHRDLGLAYRATQLAEQANADALDTLARRYDALGATVDAARCRHRLRSTGATTPSPRGRRGYGSELSPRERDVARLLAAGHTNREIAQALFLSRRTVEEYVVKVRRKLNAPSRRDIRI